MTPGEEALVEAMRFESARIYGQLQLEHVADVCTQPFASADGGASNVTHLAPPREDVA